MHRSDRSGTVLAGLSLQLLIALAVALGGCASETVSNPSFPLSLEAARAEVRAMQADPRPAIRPVVVVSGYADPGVGADFFAQQLRSLLGDSAIIIRVAPGTEGSMSAARDSLLRKLDETLPRPASGTEWTAEVDVIGVSMGGLVAAYTAMPRDDGGRRLKIARLFTICSPLRGARAASHPTLHDTVVDMREGSEFLRQLNAAPREYELFPYCRLDDRIVGEENAAPIGMNPWWVATPPMRMAHVGSVSDWRIVADIARRLRGEPAYTQPPAAPLPVRAEGGCATVAAGATREASR